jgi:hypothetical protein
LIEINSAKDLTDENIARLDAITLVNSLIYTFDLEDDFEIERVQAVMQIKARELGCLTAFNRLLATYRKQDKIEENRFKKEVAVGNLDIPLEIGSKGVPECTIDNFLMIMQNDPNYQNIRFNVLRNAPEVHTGKTVRLWNDTDLAKSKRYIEKKYKLHHETKHDDALRIFFESREYHPIQEIVDNLEWDGVERIPHFLTKWMKAEDNEYTREVSRLIFAGGIHRLYSPGCKFDDVPVLIGTSQGEGKSTIVRWLAIHDDHFAEVTEIDGQKGVEQLEGAWICEIAELLALTKAKEQEAVKSYITRQKDKYRKPWGKNTDELPRRCIFIGTTNNEQFLRDKTGNRRFYPVKVNSSGYWLYDHEQECRDYILQCWAEAKVKYDRNEMPNYADKKLMEQYKAAQDEAMEDDWRIGAIEEYLDRQPVGSYVCIRQLKHEALSLNKDFPQDPTKKDSQEIAQIMNKFDEWKKTGRKRIEGYGQQRCWEKIDCKNEFVEVDDDPPF